MSHENERLRQELEYWSGNISRYNTCRSNCRTDWT